MKIKFIANFFIIVLAISCSDHNSPANSSKIDIEDIIVGKRIVQQYEEKIIEAVYFSIRKNDTSNLRYHFLQGLSDSIEIVVYPKDPLQNPQLFYQEELQEQKLILKSASKDFKLEFLNKIWDIPLLETGDLAITVTKQLPSDYLSKQLNNIDVAKFLLTSKLTTDLNELLRPYNKKIKRYVVEKARLLKDSDFLKYNKIETSISEIPHKVLDAQIWTVIENSSN